MVGGPPCPVNLGFDYLARPMTNRALTLITVAALAAGCSKSSSSKDLGPLGLDGGCQPLLGGADCLLPYPSDYFRVADPSLPSGYRLDISSAMFIAKGGLNADPDGRFPVDGASKIPTIVTMFPEEIAKDGFVALLDDPAKSVDAKSNVLLLEADTGALVPHFVDLDPRTKDPKRQAIVIHPITGLKAKTRYIVALHGVKHPDGSAVTTPEGFRRLRDQQTAGDAQLEKLAAHFAFEIFPQIEHAGVPRGDLQMAWDFSTGSDERWRSDMLEVRAQTLAWLQSHTINVSNIQITPGSTSDTWYQVDGELEGPMFLESTDNEAPLHRDASGKVAQNGTVTIPFTAQVPAAVRDQFGPGLPMAYGHGFFGKRAEVTYDSTRNIAQHVGGVLFGVDWWGMATVDATGVAGDLSSHPTRTLNFADRVHQGMANWLVMTAAMRTVLPTNAAFQRPASGAGVSTDANGQSNAGQPIYGGDAVYLGISQGHILGGTMIALNPDIHRAVLQVGGAGFTHMMFRAKPFDDFLYFLGLGVPDALDQQKYAAALQPQFDRFDPATFADLVVTHPLEGMPADRRILLQNGLGDAEVPNLGTFLDVRLLGIPQATPNPYPIYGVPTAAEPVAGSAIVLYDFGIDLHAQYDAAQPPPDDNRVHEGLRQFVPALDQMGQFYGSGVINDTCGGACVVP